MNCSWNKTLAIAAAWALALLVTAVPARGGPFVNIVDPGRGC